MPEPSKPKPNVHLEAAAGRELFQALARVFARARGRALSDLTFKALRDYTHRTGTDMSLEPPRPWTDIVEDLMTADEPTRGLLSGTPFFDRTRVIPEADLLPAPAPTESVPDGTGFCDDDYNPAEHAAYAQYLERRSPADPHFTFSGWLRYQHQKTR